MEWRDPTSIRTPIPAVEPAAMSLIWAPKIAEWDRTLDPADRYAAAMKAEGLFEVAEAPLGHPARTSPGAR